MTTINESLTAKGYTPAALVPAAFGTRRTIDEIVIHHWGERGQSHDGVVNFFVNGPGQTSAHYVVSAGRIHCLVSPGDAAWHCPGKNATTIGIECRPEATDADYATVAELIRTLRAQYGNLPLSKHRDWYATACPGVWDLSRLDALATGSTITTQSATITPLSEEDDMTQAEKDALFEAIARIDRKADEVHARVFGRDVQRWFNPATGDVVFDARDGYIPARSTDVHDVISTNNLVVAQTDKILDAVSKIPGVDVSIISGLREQLAAELKKVTEGLQVTLAVKEEVK